MIHMNKDAKAIVAEAARRAVGTWFELVSPGKGALDIAIEHEFVWTAPLIETSQTLLARVAKIGICGHCDTCKQLITDAQKACAQLPKVQDDNNP